MTWGRRATRHVSMPDLIDINIGCFFALILGFSRKQNRFRVVGNAHAQVC